jgi:hypothetical protein
VRDEHDRRPRGLQLGLEPADRGDVEMVRGLVEKHEFRLRRHEPSERRAAPFAARGGRHRRPGIEAQSLRHARDAVLLARRQARGGIIAQRGEARHVGILLHVARGRPRREGSRAGVGFDQPRHHLEKRGLSRSVAPDERDTVAGMDDERDAGEHGGAPEGQRDVGNLEEWSLGHLRELRPARVGVNGAKILGRILAKGFRNP